MKSIEKLRKLTICDKGEKYTAYLDAGDIVDEIKREISERYIERDKAIEAPLDIDGVPWTPQDEKFDDGTDVFELSMIAYSVKTGMWYLIDNTRTSHTAKWCSHVKPSTIEDVLREFANSGTPTGEGGVMYETALIEKYADRLRDLFGGDAG